MLSPAKLFTFDIGTFKDIKDFLLIVFCVIVVSFPKDHFRNSSLTDYFRAPETRKLSGVEGTSFSDFNASFDNTTVLGVETVTT
jgi:hypothetical protein